MQNADCCALSVLVKHAAPVPVLVNCATTMAYTAQQQHSNDLRYTWHGMLNHALSVFLALQYEIQSQLCIVHVHLDKEPRLAEEWTSIMSGPSASGSG